MMPTIHRRAVAIAAVLLVPTSPTLALGDGGLVTRAAVMVGFPANGPASETGVLVVPGTVIPLAQGARRGQQVREEGARGESLAQVARSLERTLRLGRIEVRYTLVPELAVGREKELPPPSLHSTLRISLELLGASAETATYRVTFTDGPRTLADSRVAVGRGERAVVGSVGGEETPYLFLVLEPQRVAADDAQTVPRLVAGDITPPVLVHSVPPGYPLQARAARVVGVVIVQAVVDETGSVTAVKPLKGLPKGLTEEAVRAARQWRFEPARDAHGDPVAVFYNITMNFKLDVKD